LIGCVRGVQQKICESQQGRVKILSHFVRVGSFYSIEANEVVHLVTFRTVLLKERAIL